MIEFGCNYIMQTVSYSFYKNARKIKTVSIVPEYLQMTNNLTGYGYHLDANTEDIILFFGGSNDIAYNAVGKFAGNLIAHLLPRIIMEPKTVSEK